MIEIINHKENSHDLTGMVGEVCMVIFSSRRSDEACLQKRRVRGRISQRLKTFFPLVLPQFKLESFAAKNGRTKTEIVFRGATGDRCV